MKRLKKMALVGLLVAVQLLVACWIVDFAFKRYETRHLYHYASKDDASYATENFLYNDLEQQLPKKKPAGQFRVLVFGDSYTYAVTQPPHSFCAELERRLAAVVPGGDVRVINLGFPSISFPEYLEMFAFWSQALEYDAVIFNVYLGNDFNDVRETPYDARALGERLAAQCERGLPFGQNTLIPHKYPFRFLDFIKAKVLDEIHSNPRWRHLFAVPELPPGRPSAPVATAPAQATGQAPGPVTTPAPTPAAAAAAAEPPLDPADYRTLFPLTKAQMTSEMRSSLKPFVREDLLAYANNLPWYRLFLATAAREAARGVPVLVMLSPPLCAVAPAVRDQAARDLGVPPQAVDLSLPRRLTLELARQVGLPEDAVLDLTPCLAEKTPSGRSTYTGIETHWSVAGNAWVGDLLAGVLAARWFHMAPDAGAPCPGPDAADATAPALLPPGALAPDAAVTAMADRIVSGCQATP
jgi:hypothetical protein